MKTSKQNLKSLSEFKYNIPHIFSFVNSKKATAIIAIAFSLYLNPKLLLYSHYIIPTTLCQALIKTQHYKQCDISVAVRYLHQPRVALSAICIYAALGTKSNLGLPPSCFNPSVTTSIIIPPLSISAISHTAIIAPRPRACQPLHKPCNKTLSKTFKIRRGNPTHG